MSLLLEPPTTDPAPAPAGAGISPTATVPPGVGDLLLKLLGWGLWLGFWASVAGVVIAGAMMALGATSQHGNGKYGVALALALAGAVVCGSASVLVSGMSA